MNIKEKYKLIEKLLDERWESVSAEDELEGGTEPYVIKLTKVDKIINNLKAKLRDRTITRSEKTKLERALRTAELRKDNLRRNKKRVADELSQYRRQPARGADIPVGTGRTKYAIEEQCDITNNSTKDLSQLENIVSRFYPYVKEKLGFKEDAKVILISDPKNAKDPWGRTAYYNPEVMEITIFVDNRHPKDMLRSLSHELVHHSQNCRGDFQHMGALKPGYAQKDPHLRRMEGEAYLLGNGFLVRDFEDSLKQNYQNLTESKKMKKLTSEQIKTVLSSTIKRVIEENKPADTRGGDTDKPWIPGKRNKKLREDEEDDAGTLAEVGAPGPGAITHAPGRPAPRENPPSGPAGPGPHPGGKRDKIKRKIKKKELEEVGLTPAPKGTEVDFKRVSDTPSMRTDSSFDPYGTPGSTDAAIRTDQSVTPKSNAPSSAASTSPGAFTAKRDKKRKIKKKALEEAGFGEGTPPSGEMYEKRVIELEETFTSKKDQVLFEMLTKKWTK